MTWELEQKQFTTHKEANLLVHVITLHCFSKHIYLILEKTMFDEF